MPDNFTDIFFKIRNRLPEPRPAREDDGTLPPEPALVITDRTATKREAEAILLAALDTLQRMPSLPVELEHVRASLDLYVHANTLSLGQAFGLEPRRAGRPSGTGKAVEWATAVHRARVVDDLSYDAAVEHAMAEFGRSRAPVKRAYKAHCIEGLQRFLRDLGRPLDEAEKERLRLSMSRIAAVVRKLGLDIPQ